MTFAPGQRIWKKDQKTKLASRRQSAILCQARLMFYRRLVQHGRGSDLSADRTHAPTEEGELQTLMPKKRPVDTKAEVERAVRKLLKIERQTVVDMRYALLDRTDGDWLVLARFRTRKLA